MADFVLDYRAPFAPKLCGLWGPFPSRSTGDDFARALDAPGASWTVVSLRDPNRYTFPDGS